MKISEMLYAIASWLESPNNEALLLAEDNQDCAQIVAENCVLAAELLKNAAEQVNGLEPASESHITLENLQDLANLATAFDNSGDEKLKKQASLIDELLLTVAASPGDYGARKDLLESRLTELTKKYHKIKDRLKEDNHILEAEKAIDKSKITKEYRILEAPLSTRTCVDHPGAQLARVGEHQFRCSMDGKIYDYEAGYTTVDGSKVPGGSVDMQTKGIDMPASSYFDSREGRLSSNKF